MSRSRIEAASGATAAASTPTSASVHSGMTFFFTAMIPLREA